MYNYFFITSINLSNLPFSCATLIPISVTVVGMSDVDAISINISLAFEDKWNLIP